MDDARILGCYDVTITLHVLFCCSLRCPAIPCMDLMHLRLPCTVITRPDIHSPCPLVSPLSAARPSPLRPPVPAPASDPSTRQSADPPHRHSPPCLLHPHSLSAGHAPPPTSVLRTSD